MLLVVLPVAAVLGAICVSILPIAMCLVVFPEAVVDVSVSMNQPSSAIRFIIFPVSLVDASVRPNLVALTVTHVGLHVPLAFVKSVVGECLEVSFNLANSVVI